MFECSLEKGSRKFACPNCHAPQKFKRYVRRATGEYLSFDVGICDRQNSCHYHYTPKQFFADNPNTSKDYADTKTRRKKDIQSPQVLTSKDGSQANCQTLEQARAADYIPNDALLRTLTDYQQNTFVQFLLELFPENTEAVWQAVKDYLVGTFPNHYGSYTCFPYIDQRRRICRGKLIRFNQTSGKRLKGEYDTNSLVKKLKLKDGFQYKQIFFGEHLLTKYPNLPVVVVEAEKTAVLASICKGVFPDFVWLSAGSKQWLKAERLKRLGNRRIILYPDADGFELWQQIALDARRNGQAVKVSRLVEKRATDEQRTGGADLADYLIAQQKEINRYNSFVDSYNGKLEAVLNDESLLNECSTILEEQKAVMMINGDLSEAEAESRITNSESVRKIVLSL